MLPGSLLCSLSRIFFLPWHKRVRGRENMVVVIMNHLTAKSLIQQLNCLGLFLWKQSALYLVIFSLFDAQFSQRTDVAFGLAQYSIAPSACQCKHNFLFIVANDYLCELIENFLKSL